MIEGGYRLQYMGVRLEPRNDVMRRSKVLYNGGMIYSGSHDSAYEHPREVQHAAHSLSGLGQVSAYFRCSNLDSPRSHHIADSRPELGARGVTFVASASTMPMLHLPGRLSAV